MQTTRLLRLSLLLNAILFALTTALVVQRRTGERPAGNEAATTASEAARPDVTLVVVTNITIVTNTFHWSQIESTNYVTYRDNLRAVGAPEQTIADLIECDLRAALLAEEPTAATHPYWQDVQAVQHLGAIRVWQREIEINAILAALGLPAPSVRPPPGIAAADVSFLPADLQSQVSTLEARYQRLTAERASLSNGRYTNEDLDFLAQLDAQHDSDLRALLGPAAFFEYQVRNSATAQRLREATVGFDATEDEFRRIFQIEQQYEELAQTVEEDEAVAWRGEQLAAALGPPRAAEFLKSQDPAFHDAYTLASRHKLGAAAADALYQARRDFEHQVQAVAEQEVWTEDQKTQAILAFRAQKLAELVPRLGKSIELMGIDWLSVPWQVPTTATTAPHTGLP